MVLELLHNGIVLETTTKVNSLLLIFGYKNHSHYFWIAYSFLILVLELKT